MGDNGTRLICLGVITSVHGVRGQVKLRSFTTSPDDITSYGPLIDKHGKAFALVINGETKDALIATVDGVTTREQAEKLKGTELFVPRSALPKPSADEYYHEDLVGIRLLTESGISYGTVVAVHNFGAGDLIAIRPAEGGEEMLPFRKTIFSGFDFAAGTAVIHPPEIVQGDPSEARRDD